MPDKLPISSSRMTDQHTAIDIRKAAIELTFCQGRDLGNAPPRWKRKDLIVHLKRPSDSSVFGRSELLIWTPEQTVFHAHWSPYDNTDFSVVVFNRGTWEQQLIDTGVLKL